MVFSHKVKVFFLTWFMIIGIDFFLHGGLLAFLYVDPHPFLRSPTQAFQFIPLGYLAFALQVLLLMWLLERLHIKTMWEGAWFALRLGVLVWGGLILGLLSIANAPLSLLLGWLFGQSLEMSIGGMVAGYGLGTPRLRRLALWVFLSVVGLIVVTIIMQNVGLAPAVRINPD